MIRSFPVILKELDSLVFSAKLKLGSKFYPNLTRSCKKRDFHSSTTRFFNTGNVDELVWPTEVLVPLGTGKSIIKKSDQNVPKLFVVHGIEGHVRILHFLGDFLKGPSYGFQLATSVVGLAMKDTATEYIKELKKVQPKGPYVIGGYSSGAAIAFEMLMQLEQKHKDKVSNFILLDGHLRISRNEFNINKFVQELVTGYFEELAEQMCGLGHLTQDKTNKEIYQILLNIIRPAVPFEKYQKFKQFFDLLLTYMDSIEGFNPTYEYTGNTLLIKAEEGSPTYGMSDPEPKARKNCKGPVTVRTVKGNHHTFLLAPLVEGTADVLNAYLHPESNQTQ